MNEASKEEVFVNGKNEDEEVKPVERESLEDKSNDSKDRGKNEKRFNDQPATSSNVNKNNEN